MKVNNFVCKDLDSLMKLMLTKEKDYSYIVAWIDTLNKKMRGVLTCGENALKNDLSIKSSNLLSYSLNEIITPSFMPNGILNKVSLNFLMNCGLENHYLKKNDVQTISHFSIP